MAPASSRVSDSAPWKSSKSQRRNDLNNFQQKESENRHFGANRAPGERPLSGGCPRPSALSLHRDILGHQPAPSSPLSAWLLLAVSRTSVVAVVGRRLRARGGSARAPGVGLGSSHPVQPVLGVGSLLATVSSGAAAASRESFWGRGCQGCLPAGGVTGARALPSRPPDRKIPGAQSKLSLLLCQLARPREGLCLGRRASAAGSPALVCTRFTLGPACSCLRGPHPHLGHSRSRLTHLLVLAARAERPRCTHIAHSARKAVFSWPGGRQAAELEAAPCWLGPRESDLQTTCPARQVSRRRTRWSRANMEPWSPLTAQGTLQSVIFSRFPLQFI